MITVDEAEKIILATKLDLGSETIPLQEGFGRVLAEDLPADRDIPAFNRVTMDGIGINFTSFSQGIRQYKILCSQSAGEPPVGITNISDCIELMTGASIDVSIDTVIRYEDIVINNGLALLTTENIRQGQNIHKRGSDKPKGDVLVAKGNKISAPIIGIAASIGKSELKVKRLPRIAIITTGNELVAINDTPLDYQIRGSNNYTIHAALSKLGINAEMFHTQDDLQETMSIFDKCLNKFDVLLITGGISMGKYDYVANALLGLNVQQLIHKIKQRPGKPFWFGKRGDANVVFALPGNPVSAFLCLLRYFIPWLHSILGLANYNCFYAILNSDVSFKHQMQYFMQVKVVPNKSGQLFAYPMQGNGSGDYSNLSESNAFMELPADKEVFKKGEVYRVWNF